MYKVAKFGGTSLANAECLRNVREIVDGDRTRRFIVPSAPGKEHHDDVKITDLLYLIHEIIEAKQDPTDVWTKIEARFLTICSDLDLQIDISSVLEEVFADLTRGVSREHASSRGEYINGHILATLLEADFVDAAEVVRFDENGRFDPMSYSLIADRCTGEGRFVIPGFYGAKPDGTIDTFSRGGSDVTGSIVANAVDAEVYENWTDISGFCMADPRIVPDAKQITEMTYSELRELSYMGASVLHEEAIFPVKAKGIPINIRNTREPDNPGTLIVNSRNVHAQVVTGIAGKSNFTVFFIEKAMMNEEIGFGRRILEVFERYGVSFEHMPSGIDTLSVVASREQVGQNESLIIEELQSMLVDRVDIIRGISLIATVGQEMNHSVGTAARLFGALAKHDVNIRIIDQGSSEQNIIIGVDDDDFKLAIKAIHDEFANQ